MPTYKAFWIDRRTDLVRSETIKAHDDEQACALANGASRGVRQEVWDGERYVGTIEVDRGDHHSVRSKRQRI